MNISKSNRQILLFVFFIFFAIYFAILAKEITTLVISSYFVAVLLEPLLKRLEKIKIPRGLALFAIACIFLGIVILFFFLVLPIIIEQYSILINNFPDYLKGVLDSTDYYLQRKFHTKLPLDAQSISNRIKQYSSYMSTDQLGVLFQTMNSTLISGYSYALTMINFLLFPIFIFYIALDIDKINKYIKNLIPSPWRNSVLLVSKEIRSKLYIFFKGQITVSLILCLLYSLVLSLAGLPSGFIVGLITGLLSFFPYVGFCTGLFVSLIITFIHSPELWPFTKLIIAFALVQSIDAFLLTPRIMGTNLGLSPLVVILALLIGGKILGLLGLIIAIPLVASLSILLKYFSQEMNR